MAFFKITSVLMFPIFLVLILCTNFALSQTDQQKIREKTIPGCVGYVDLSQSRGSERDRSITIPKSRTSQVTYPSIEVPAENSLKFRLREHQKIKCADGKKEIVTLPFEVIVDATKLMPRNFSYISAESTVTIAISHSYFTSTGYFYDNATSNYYKPNGDYCVASYSKDSITLHVCPVSQDCSISSLPNALCAPKCCGIDEVLQLSTRSNRQCVKTTETIGMTPWIPPIFRAKNPHQKLDGVQNNLIFHMPRLPGDCNLKTLPNGRTKALLKSFFGSATYFAINNQTFEKNTVKLGEPSSGENGIIQFLYLNTNSRSWKPKERLVSFCVDGFWIESADSPKYTGKEDDFVVLYCDTEKPKPDFSSAEAVTWAYSVISFVCLLLLLATVIIYVLLWEKQNLHGMTILFYSVSTFGSYLFLLIAHLQFLFPNGLLQGGYPCYFTAILGHYFFFASYLWLSAMNFDLFLSFSAIRVVSKDQKEWKKLGWYSLLAWIFPVAIIVAFAVVNNVYRDPISEVPVPGYGDTNCFVSTEFRGEYVYIPLAIILAVNILLIGLTFKIFIEAKYRRQGLAGGVSNASSYSGKLFGKLFAVMGGTEIVNFFTWYYNASTEKPWPIVVIECISYILPPLVMFILFCLNEKTLNQLRDKFPGLMGSFESVLRCCRKDAEGLEDHSIVSNKTQTSTLEMNIRER